MTPKTFDVLTVSEFCQAVGISRSTWQKLKRQGKAPAIVNIGGIQRIRQEAIAAWFSENEARPTADAPHNAAEIPEPPAHSQEKRIEQSMAMTRTN
jgi:excisionase family DNA binding protein